MAKKPTRNIAYKSEWNMTELDFKRIHEILKSIDEYYFLSSIGKRKVQIKYLSSLKALYRYIRPLLTVSKQKDFDSDFDSLRKDIMKEKDVFGDIEVLHDKVMDLRQYSGIGLFVSKSVRDPTKTYMKDDIE